MTVAEANAKPGLVANVGIDDAIAQHLLHSGVRMTDPPPESRGPSVAVTVPPPGLA